MGCDHPLTGYYSKDVGRSGKRGITFDRNASFSAVPMKLPCGRCTGCRLEHSRQWAVRCMHERMSHVDNVFLTLTYEDRHLPFAGSLDRKAPQLFLKRLRDAVSPTKFRFYGCGEYGERFKRPHYHLILFGLDFADKRFYKKAKGGEDLYTSDFVRKYWPFGFNVLGNVDFHSCAYVARYVTAKVSGHMANYTKQYDRLVDGKVYKVLPEFSMMSRMPGIGSAWFDQYGEQAYAWDSVVLNGREMRPPRFYDGRYEVLDKDHFAFLKRQRRRVALAHADDNSSARRHVKEEVLQRNLAAKLREF